MIGWADARREPFRIFFPLGTLLGLVGITHWLVYALGWAGAYSGFFHAGIQVGGYMLGFILGFLLTALPRFAGTAPASSAELTVFLALFLTHPVLLALGQWIAAEAAFIGLLLLLVVFAGRRFATRRATVGPPPEFIWIGLGVLHGLLGAGLLMLGQAGVLPVWALAVGRPMAQQGFLLSIVLGVGGFMAPRLMGRDFLHISPAGVSAREARRVRRRRLTLHALAGGLLFGSFLLEGAGAIPAAYGLRAAVVTGELAWTTQFYRPPAVPDRYVQLVCISLWVIVCGLWGAALLVRHRVAMLHLMFLGGFSLMAFAVGTMVVLSHAGAGERLRRPLWVLNVVGLGIAGAVAARLAAELLPAWFFPFLGLAAACWSLAGLSWLGFALPYVVRSVPPETFARVHDAVKRQVMDISASRPHG